MIMSWGRRSDEQTYKALLKFYWSDTIYGETGETAGKWLLCIERFIVLLLSRNRVADTRAVSRTAISTSCQSAM
jgi:hypothetical protein